MDSRRAAAPPSHEGRLPRMCRVRERVRLLDVRIVRLEVDDFGPEDPIVITIGGASEAFVMPEMD